MEGLLTEVLVSIAFWNIVYLVMSIIVVVVSLRRATRSAPYSRARPFLFDFFCTGYFLLWAFLGGCFFRQVVFSRTDVSARMMLDDARAFLTASRLTHVVGGLQQSGVLFFVFHAVRRESPREEAEFLR